MEQPDYLSALEQYKRLDARGKAIVDQRMALEQQQGRNPMEYLQRVLRPHPHSYTPGSYTSGVRG